MASTSIAAPTLRHEEARQVGGAVSTGAVAVAVLPGNTGPTVNARQSTGAVAVLPGNTGPNVTGRQSTGAVTVLPGNTGPNVTNRQISGNTVTISPTNSETGNSGTITSTDTGSTVKTLTDDNGVTGAIGSVINERLLDGTTATGSPTNSVPVDVKAVIKVLPGSAGTVADGAANAAPTIIGTPVA